VSLPSGNHERAPSLRFLTLLCQWNRVGRPASYIAVPPLGVMRSSAPSSPLTIVRPSLHEGRVVAEAIEKKARPIGSSRVVDKPGGARPRAAFILSPAMLASSCRGAIPRLTGHAPLR